MCVIPGDTALNMQPIGVIDSGVGGLSTLRSLLRLLPHERFIYFADLAHAPYGNKPPALIQARTARIACFMRTQNVKALVVACNTVCAVHGPTLRHLIDVPVFDVLQAGARFAARQPNLQDIGILATEATVRTRAYEQQIRGLRPAARVATIACPQLVTRIEQGLGMHPDTRTLLAVDLARLDARRRDAVIIGCTHFAFLRQRLGELLGPAVSVIDPGSLVAGDLRQAIDQGQIGANHASRASPPLLFASRDSPGFRDIARAAMPMLGGALLHCVNLDRTFLACAQPGKDTHESGPIPPKAAASSPP